MSLGVIRSQAAQTAFRSSCKQRTCGPLALRATALHHFGGRPHPRYFGLGTGLHSASGGDRGRLFRDGSLLVLPKRGLSVAAMWGRPAIRKEAPGPGQESVWDYPRPPRLEKTPKHIKVEFNGETIVDTRNSYRVLETSHPPTYYLPPEDIKMEYFTESPGQSSFCEWKGSATYWTIKVGDKEARNVAWSYENPTPSFKPIKDHIALYAAPMDGCYVDGEKASPQPGGFYGGWVTKDIVGPIKGIPGSMGW